MTRVTWARPIRSFCPVRLHGKIKALGNQLSALLDEYVAINSIDTWDEDVAVIDKMVDVLDKLTGICDDHH